MDIQLPDLWQKFKDRFDLDINQPQSMSVSNVVHPVTLIDGFYVEPSYPSYYASSVFCTGTGLKKVFTVPADETWEVTGVSSFTGVGYFTFDKILIGPGWGRLVLVGDPGVILIFSGITLPFYLKPADSVVVNVDSYTGPSWITSDITCIKHKN